MASQIALNEEKILNLWNKLDILKLVKQKSDNENKVFEYIDGPPFVSSESLHYGHTLISFIKDTIVKYLSMNGYNVKMTLGYDCHGLPIEDKIMKLLNLKTIEDIKDYGIDNFNKVCKDFVYKCEGSWTTFYDRIGRWLEKKNNYKTMDTKFMETVWYVFKQIYEKGLVYRGYKVMPYSIGCETPLSNFEANLNYKSVKDTAVTISFPLLNNPETSILAWTTTPWTLPSNMALCVNPNHIYVTIQDHKTQNKYILAKNCLGKLYSKKNKNKYDILDEYKGSNLENKLYIPLFNYLPNHTFKIVCDTFVGGTHKKEKEKEKEKEKGTGVVHLAPAHGHDDYNVCLENNIITKESCPCFINTEGKFTQECKEYENMYIKDANSVIINDLKQNNRLIKKEVITHNYPYCWRTDTALIYMIVPSVFISVEKIKDNMISNNNKTNWTPEHIKVGRFGKWLEGAKDWGISRNRFFGTPIPLWLADDGTIKVIGSIEELKTFASNQDEITDIHMEYIDKLTFEQEGKTYKRIPDVFDCWFESGSVPFGQIHWPFNKDKTNYFENKEYICDLISEGIDQTRGWFYTLTVISTAILNKPAFKNVICSGLILASDGKKMSKRLKNYPEQEYILNKYGSDALRLYLINSPTVKGESFKFNENDIGTLLYSKLMPWLSSLKFFEEHYILFTEHKHILLLDGEQNNNYMDKWIMSKLGSLCERIDVEMQTYKLYNILPHLIMFIEDLTNWYIKFNRSRLKGYNGVKEWNNSLNTLYKTLMSFAIIMAPFTPFLSEQMYQKLIKLVQDKNRMKPSVHLYDYPKVSEFTNDKEIELTFETMQSISTQVRKMKNDMKYNNKMSVKEIIIINDNCSINDIIPYLKEDLSAIDINYDTKLENYVSYIYLPKMNKLGKKYRREARKIANEIEKISVNFNNKLKIIVDSKEYIIEEDEYDISTKINYPLLQTQQIKQINNRTLVIVDFEQNKEIMDIYNMRLIKAAVQQLRKESNLHPWNKITIYFDSNENMLNTIEQYTSYFENIFRYPIRLEKPVENISSKSKFVLETEELNY